MIKNAKNISNWAPFLLGGAMFISGLTGLGSVSMPVVSLSLIDVSASDAEAQNYRAQLGYHWSGQRRLPLAAKKRC
jgi:hypothetical protein